jgi:hypothetical protein
MGFPFLRYQRTINASARSVGGGCRSFFAGQRLPRVAFIT